MIGSDAQSHSHVSCHAFLNYSSLELSWLWVMSFTELLQWCLPLTQCFQPQPLVCSQCCGWPKATCSDFSSKMGNFLPPTRSKVSTAFVQCCKKTAEKKLFPEHLKFNTHLGTLLTVYFYKKLITLIHVALSAGIFLLTLIGWLTCLKLSTWLRALRDWG